MAFTALISEDVEPDFKDPISLTDLAAQKGPKADSMLSLMAGSPRFGKVILKDYKRIIDDTYETTFYAATFLLSRFDTLIVFRGTDGSLMSWKENFNTIYRFPTQGQICAKEYLEAMIGTCRNPFMRFWVAGHSKGGNLALYASVYCDSKVKKKISHAFLYDAPGFLTDISEEPSFTEVKERITAYVPEGCVIGKLLIQPCELNAIEATGKGVYQHDTYNWIVDSEGLVSAAGTNDFSERLSSKVNDWIRHIPMSERQKVVNELFDVFKKNGILHLEDLIHIDLKHLLGVLMSATTLSSENRSLLMIIFRELRN